MWPKSFFLESGDTVGVAAPSARFDPEELERGVKRLKSMGFQVRVPEGIFGAHRYLAGSDRIRADVLMSLFKDPDVKAIIPARGGYGAMRILPLLNWSVIRSHPTAFVGFSDASALISCLVSKAGIPAFHGPNLVSLARADGNTLSGFERVMTGRLEPVSMISGECLVPGIARGRFLGGNLATLVHLVGTRFQPDFDGSIFFFEDVGEPAYKIDRMLTHLSQAGLLKGVRGVVTGGFTDCANPEYIPQIIMEAFGPLKIPVIMGLDAGHGEKNLTLPMGVASTLNTREQTLEWDGGV